MSNNSQKFSLLINADYFDWKTIEKTKVKKPFLQIHSKYHDNLKGIDNKANFKKQIISSSDNTILFYTGVEERTKAKFKEKIQIVKKFVLSIFPINKNDCNATHRISNGPYLTKTLINDPDNKNKGKRLLSLLFEITFSNSLENGTQNLHILFPLEYSNLHK